GIGAKISVLILISFVQNIFCSFLARKRFFLKQDRFGLYLKKRLKSSGGCFPSGGIFGYKFYDKRLASL
ncbi:MAG: hypothetical protein K8S18_20995, partial [Desulfobacula sp.]|nr:hypothetical protein [Desulfobacula sp.]